MTQRSGSPKRSPHGRTYGGASGGAAPPSSGGSDPARRAAYDVLCAVRQRDAYANLLLPSVLRDRGVSGRDAALATELTYGTLRGQGSYDAVLDVCIDRSLASVDAEVVPLLRLGAHQLLATKIPPHAAVSATVQLSRTVVGRHRSKFVNAVLRKVSARNLEQWLAVVSPPRAEDPLGNLAVCHSHPRWIVAALAESLGETAEGELRETEQLLATHNERPLVPLVAKPGRATVEELLHSGAVPASYSPYAAYLPEGDPAMLPEVHQRRAAVQDEASQLAALAVLRTPVEGRDSYWLDTCAGPGGKAGLLAGTAGQRGARLIASEVRPARAGLLADAVGESTGEARVIVADSTRPAWQSETFDRVLVDVPCSGLGALRRRPESRWRRTEATVAELASLQRELLERALDAVRPGGVVGYATCSPHLGETQGVVEAVRGERDDVTAVRAADQLSGVPDVAAGEYAQFWPHRHGTDAIFVALLRKH